MAPQRCHLRAAGRARIALRRAIAGAAMGLSLLGLAASARADGVDDWSRIALAAAVAESPDLDHATHTLDTVHAAMFDAMVHLAGPGTTACTPR